MTTSSVKDPNRKHEPADLRPAMFWFILIGLALLIAGSLAASWLTVLSSSAHDLTVETTPLQFPAPGVQANQSLTRQELIHSQRKALDSYGWSDREPGIARIPIDRAMQLMTPRHLAGLVWTPGEHRGSRIEDRGSNVISDPPSSILHPRSSLPSRPPVEAAKEPRP